MTPPPLLMFACMFVEHTGAIAQRAQQMPTLHWCFSHLAGGGLGSKLAGTKKCMFDDGALRGFWAGFVSTVQSAVV